MFPLFLSSMHSAMALSSLHSAMALADKELNSDKCVSLFLIWTFKKYVWNLNYYMATDIFFKDLYKNRQPEKNMQVQILNASILLLFKWQCHSLIWKKYPYQTDSLLGCTSVHLSRNHALAKNISKHLTNSTLLKGANNSAVIELKRTAQLKKNCLLFTWEKNDLNKTYVSCGSKHCLFLTFSVKCKEYDLHRKK